MMLKYESIVKMIADSFSGNQQMFDKLVSGLDWEDGKYKFETFTMIKFVS